MFKESTNYFYQNKLREELVQRMDRNPRYSLRSFAATLGLDSSSLSQIFSGKRSVSTRVIGRIFKTLELSPEEQKHFIESVLLEKKEKGLDRVSPKLSRQLSDLAGTQGKIPHGIGLDTFRVVADWYHFAILELTFCCHFKPDSKWIARQLGISELEAKLAVERLIRLELLESKSGALKKTNFKLGTKDKSKTSPFHKKRQKQILEKSTHSLDQDPIETRNHSGITICIDPENIPEAKIRIQKFYGKWETC